MRSCSPCLVISVSALLFLPFGPVESFTFAKNLRRQRQSPPSNTCMLESSSNGNDKDLIQSLEESLDYEGRLPSKSLNADDFHCGFCSIIGAANMGKSTLLNALLQQDLCIATRRPQTTRHSILGVLQEQNTQLLLVDTPGVLEEPAYKLQEGMMQAVSGAIDTADLLLVVTDLFSTPIPNDAILKRVQKSRKSKIVVINKVDLVTKVKNDEASSVSIEEAVHKWRMILPDALLILPVSASEGMGVSTLRNVLLASGDVEKDLRDLGRPIAGMFLPGDKTFTQQQARALLPKSPPLYDQDTLTDRSERFFASEMIRASLFRNLKKELPYCCEVQVTEFKDRGSLISMTANVLVERDSQKRIVIGRGGRVIKQVGIDARKDLQEFFQSKVRLDLSVKVDKDWRKNESRLKQLGYLK